MRIHGFPSAIQVPLHLFREDAPLKAHPAYVLAKAGDVFAALSVVEDLAYPLAMRARAAFEPGTIYMAPHAREATGDNAIPQVLAQAVAYMADGEADEEVVQINRVFHTGADPMERLNHQPAFAGAIKAGARHVLVDDVMTMGGTLAELAHHVQANGGAVIGAVVIVNASRTGRLIPEPRLMRILETRHGDTIRDLFRIEPSALSADEARYLLGFRTADELRNRSAKARQETNLRLRAKSLHRLGGQEG